MANLIREFQKILSFGNCTSKNFSGNGLGKIGTTGFVLGLIGGVHFGVYITITLINRSGIILSTSAWITAVVCDYINIIF